MKLYKLAKHNKIHKTGWEQGYAKGKADHIADISKMVEEMRKENRYSKDESWTDEMSTATDGFNEALDQLQTELDKLNLTQRSDL